VSGTGRRSGDETRDRLIDSARAIFSRRGYHGTTTAEIAASAGCSEPTLFKHFGSKQALLMAALHETGASTIAFLDEPAPPGVDPFEAFVERARSLLFNPLLGQMSRLRNFALALSDEVDLTEFTGVTALYELVATAVAAAQDRGVLRKDVSPEHVAQLAFSISLLFAFYATIDGDDAAARRLSPLVDTLFTMLRVSERNDR